MAASSDMGKNPEIFQINTCGLFWGERWLFVDLYCLDFLFIIWVSYFEASLLFA
jgi:hypothetical protein